MRDACANRSVGSGLARGVQWRTGGRSQAGRDTPHTRRRDAGITEDPRILPGREDTAPMRNVPHATATSALNGGNDLLSPSGLRLPRVRQ